MTDRLATDRIAMTRSGYDKLIREIQQLRVERSEVSRAMGVARDLGDLSENAEYDAAKAAQALNFARLVELEDRLARAAVVDVANLAGDKVSFGVKVALLNLDSDESVVYRIVCAYEARVEDGLLPIDSPLAKALLGKKAGDIVELSLPKGKRQYEILKIMVEE